MIIVKIKNKFYRNKKKMKMKILNNNFNKIHFKRIKNYKYLIEFLLLKILKSLYS